MRKIFTACAFLLGLGLSLSAQKLASFEDGDTDLLIVGDKWYDASRFIIEPSIDTNSDQSGLNTSKKCFKAVNVADADWWGNFGELKLTTPITITENNRYLKFLAYRSIQPKEFRVAINGDHEQEVYYGKLSEDGKWQGMVVDLGEKLLGKELTSIVFLYSTNWSDPRTGWGAATYMFDEFELSNDMIPIGEFVKDPTDFHISFENDTEFNGWVKNVDLLNETNSYEVIDNNLVSDINDSKKIVKFNKGAEASWWQGFRMVYNGILDLTKNEGNNFLHVMTYIPTEVFEKSGQMSVDVMLCAKDHTGKEQTQTLEVWDDQDGQWVDLVMQITNIDYLKELTIRFDVQKNGEDWVLAPANTFYFDDIVLNQNSEPRDKVTPSSINSDHLSSFLISGGEQLISIDNVDQQVAVEVYNIAGVLVKKQTISNSIQLPVAAGLYIVKVVSGADSKVQKVLVK